MSKRTFQVIDTPQETLTNHTIPETKDVSCVQNRSELSYTIGEEGVLIVHFNTDQFVAADGDDLVAGKYKLDSSLLHKAMIVFGTPIIDVGGALSAGAATITLEQDDGTVVATLAADLTSTGVSTEVAALPIGTKAAEDLYVHVELSADATGGAFVLYIPEIVGTGHEGVADFI